MAVFTFAVSAASSLTSGVPRCGAPPGELQAEAPSAAAMATASAARNGFIACFPYRWAGGQRRSASARARAPRAAARARGRRAAADRTASARAPTCPDALLLAVFPFANLLFRFVACAAVTLLDLADELVALAGHAVELVVGKLAPALPHRAFHLLPVACNAVPVHLGPHGVEIRRCTRCKTHAGYPRALRGCGLHQARHRGEQRD